MVKIGGVVLAKMTVKDNLSEGVFIRMGNKLRLEWPQILEPQIGSGDAYSACLLELTIREDHVIAVYGLFKIYQEGWG